MLRWRQRGKQRISIVMWPVPYAPHVNVQSAPRVKSKEFLRKGSWALGPQWQPGTLCCSSPSGFLHYVGASADAFHYASFIPRYNDNDNVVLPADLAKGGYSSLRASYSAALIRPCQHWSSGDKGFVLQYPEEANNARKPLLSCVQQGRTDRKHNTEEPKPKDASAKSRSIDPL